MYSNKSYLVDVDPQYSVDTPKFKILENTLATIFTFNGGGIKSSRTGGFRSDFVHNRPM